MLSNEVLRMVMVFPFTFFPQQIAPVHRQSETVANICVSSHTKVNKKTRQDEKEKERLGDLEYIKKYAAMLEKQEMARSEHMKSLRDIQVTMRINCSCSHLCFCWWERTSVSSVLKARQERDAQTRPPAKRWVDPEIIEKHFNAREATLKAEDEQQQKSSVQRKLEMIHVLEKQKEEKRIRQEAAKKIEMASTPGNSSA